MILTIDSKWELGQEVYLKTDKEQAPRTLIGIIINPNGHLYQLTRGSAEPSLHYECEISDEKNILIKSDYE